MRLQSVWIPGVFCRRGLSTVAVLSLEMNLCECFVEFGELIRRQRNNQSNQTSHERFLFFVLFKLDAYEGKCVCLVGCFCWFDTQYYKIMQDKFTELPPPNDLFGGFLTADMDLEGGGSGACSAADTCLSPRSHTLIILITVQRPVS